MQTPTQPQKQSRGASARASSRSAKPPGGKALARLRLFTEQRGIPVEPTVAAKAKRSGAKTRAPRAATALSGKSVGDAYFAAFSAQAQPRERSTMAAATAVAAGWRPLGPFSIPHGQTYGSGPQSRPSVSGRIATIAVDPANYHLRLRWEDRSLYRTR